MAQVRLVVANVPGMPEAVPCKDGKPMLEAAARGPAPSRCVVDNPAKISAPAKGDLRWTTVLVFSLLLGLASACSDLPWADSNDDTCAVYAANSLCTTGGAPGPNWDPAWGVLADYAVDGISGSEACCACGGGTAQGQLLRPGAAPLLRRLAGVCEDDPPTWSAGDVGCAEMEAWALCTADGSYGPNWDKDWGTFADWAVDGITATDACCACGGGAGGNCQNTEATDSGGDMCAYYELHPEHCGCCDTSNFAAFEDCCSCKSFNATGVNLTAVVASWPRKATRLPSRLAEYTSNELADIAVRCPDLEEVDVQSAGLRGVIPPELGSLSRLRILILADNELHGSIPPELADLSNLDTLHLQKNSLSGRIPPELGGMASLRDLRVFSNWLTGSLPPELGKLGGLEHMHFDSNDLNGIIPTEFGGLASMKDLQLHWNQLSGFIPPQLGKLSALEVVTLGGNSLNGSIPPELGKLGRMTWMFMDDNKLTGSIPPEFGHLSTLKWLFLTNNDLSGIIPSVFGNLTNLTSLHLSDNSLSGGIPPELGNLTSLIDLKLQMNRLSGPLPPELGNLSSLLFMHLNDNFLSGSIPSEFGKLHTVFEFCLYVNQLTGSLPPELGNMISLEQMWISENHLSGPLPPQLANLSILEFLDLHNNKLSGSIPPGYGNLRSLKFMGLYDNKLTGSIPSEFGQLSFLEYLLLQENSINGTIPANLGEIATLRDIRLSFNQLSGPLPVELGNVRSLERLRLSANVLTGGLPLEFGKLSYLTILDVGGNALITGSLAALAGMESLQEFYAEGCGFTAAAALPATLDVLHLSGNKLTEIPSEWRTEPMESLRTLRLDRNSIEDWELTGVLPSSVYAGGIVVCGRSFIEPHLRWPKLSHLNVSGNPLNLRARDFLHSLAYLPSLLTLDAATCGLHGDVPWEFGTSLAPAIMGDVSCIDSDSGTEIDMRTGFRTLVRLDLSGNEITGLDVSPSEALTIVDLSRNKLSGLKPDWYNEQGLYAVASLNVRGNPGLQRHVNINEGGLCPVSGADQLLANSLAYAGTQETRYECTRLCPGSTAWVLSDISFNETALCRCTSGQGVGTECTACPNDTFSESSFDTGHWKRVCRTCPMFSEFREHGEANHYHDCQCEVGLYMVDVEVANASYGECKRCPQWPFRTTMGKGADSEGDCDCSPEFAGILGSGNSCGCQDEYFMDHVNRACSPCSAHEACVWGVLGVRDSLKPPKLRAGFWALPPPVADEFGRSTFAGHTIWQCASKSTCLDKGECNLNRMGQACGLCTPGHYGPFNDQCVKCLYPPRKARALLVTSLALSVPLPLLLHLWLESASDPKGIALKLRALQTSLGQFSQFLQVWGIIASFRVEWPMIANDFFSFGASATTEAPSYLGIACLADAQSIELELGFRWLTPLALVLVIGTCAALLRPCLFVLRAVLSRITKKLPGVSIRMGPWEGLRVFALSLNLFYATLLQWGFTIFSCVRSPNGQYTVAKFPHVRCAADETTWVTLAVIGSVYTVFILAMFPMGLYLAWRQAAKCVAESSLKSKGWWRFWFEPYRPVEMSWIISVMGRSILLNVAAVAAVGNAMAQLVLAAVICAGFAFKAIYTLPYYDITNAVLDVWYGLAAAMICLMISAAGFQMDASALVPGDEYERIVAAVVIVQFLSFVGPAVVMTYQLLTAFDKTKWLVPYRFRPLEYDEHAELSQDFCSSVGAVGQLQFVLQGLDNIEIRAFWQLMARQKPTLGMMDLQPRMSPLGRSNSEFISRVSSRLSCDGSFSAVRSDGMGRPKSEPQEVPVKEKEVSGAGEDRLRRAARELEAAAGELSGADVEARLKDVDRLQAAVDELRGLLKAAKEEEEEQEEPDEAGEEAFDEEVLAI